MTRLQSNLTNNELVTGSALMLSCMADALPSPDFYRFSQNGNALRNTRGVLTIDKAIISHEGVYECTPHNILGAGQAAVLNITVLGKNNSVFDAFFSNIFLWFFTVPM